MRSLILWAWMPILLFGFTPLVRAGRPTLTVSAPIIGSFSLELAQRYTTNLIFPFPIANVDLGTGEIIAKKMKNIQNVLLLKAGKSHFAPTNVSVYLENGRLYSFRVTYADSPAILNYSFLPDSAASIAANQHKDAIAKFTSWPVDKGRMQEDEKLITAANPFQRAAASASQLHLTLRGTYLKDELLWLRFSARNTSQIDFKPELLRCSLEDTKAIKRTAVQSIEIAPVYTPASTTLAGRSKTDWALGFAPFTIDSGKRLVIEWGGQDGRRLRLHIKRKYLLRAKDLNPTLCQN
ncbi:MAG: DUF4138 domain-containing protein [Bacteroidetes bacterium]|nr:DUF4138 domain-containing protein [Bacteroidota bacterium]